MPVIEHESCSAVLRCIAQSSRVAVSLLAIAAIVLAFGCKEKDTATTAGEKPAEARAHGDKLDEHENGRAERSAEVKLTSDAIARYGVKIESASLRKLQPTITAPARITFNAEGMAHVGSPLPGRIVELSVRLGDAVKKGDVVLVVESPQLGETQSDFLQKQIAAKTAVAAVDLAKNSLDRATRLYDENRGIALDDVQKREVEYKSAQAALLTSQAAATAAENKLHLLGMNQISVNELRTTSEVHPRFSIVAPVAGEVLEREVTLGELVQPEREALLVLADTHTLWVLADVPEARVKEVAIGAKALIQAGSVDPHKHEGNVSYIAPMIDPRTRTASVRIAVVCEDHTLRPGMFVQAEITSNDPTNPDPPAVIAIPDEAIQTIDGVTVLFVPVPHEDNTFTKRTVVAGKPVAGQIPIYSGLVAGEAFVASGSFILKAELLKGSAQSDE
ncbi:MAG: efflux RND transporter periplasmic adaptor subunit [Planctomycetes bacterium]|nr:efflux RND transporter periplasmic adaptor subunit [Planctomycetota bacterium]MBI3833431.1 efflux RND transporter periplasmic adaptor subunit [Planctomycetota bacterium]